MRFCESTEGLPVLEHAEAGNQRVTNQRNRGDGDGKSAHAVFTWNRGSREWYKKFLDINPNTFYTTIPLEPRARTYFETLRFIHDLH